MKDRLGREIEYLRLSVTQNCNLKCIYCSPDKDTKAQSPCSALNPAEIESIVASMAKLGISKVRITGGEPLLRSDVCEIIERIAKLPGIQDISMTTNGIKLCAQAGELKKAGLTRVNVSLDSLLKDRFEHITGGGKLDDVINGLEKAVSVGLKPVKINTVLIKGVNDDEVDAFIELAKDKPIEVRFIELMPVGHFGERNQDKVVFNSDIIAARPSLELMYNSFENGPAKIYSIKGYKGLVGFISPMSHKFCKSCNRIRLTCDGKIKLCLGSNNEFDITCILRNSPESLDEAIKEIILNKPEGHNFNENFVSHRGMSAIGG